MKLDVPFVKTLSQWKGNGWCGPVALRSILSCYKIRGPIEEIVRIAKTPDNDRTPTFGLAYFCLTKGLKVQYISEEEIQSGEKYSDRLKDFMNKGGFLPLESKMVIECKKFENYSYIKKKPDIKIIEKLLDQKIPILALFNVMHAFKKDSPDLFWGGHYTVIVGYDKSNFYIHNNSWPKNEAYMKINKKLFLESMSTDGFKRIIIAISK